MRQLWFKIEENTEIAKDTMKLILSGDAIGVERAGQFVNLKIEGFYLRRPISISDYSENSLTLIYKIVGDGTLVLSKMQKGEKIDTLIPLGNGYNIDKAGDKPLLIGGGVGAPPLYNLAKKLVEKLDPKDIKVVLGFNDKLEVFYEEEFKALGVDTKIVTVNGNYEGGSKGFVTDVIKDMEYSYFYTCGPMPMFKAIEKNAKTSGQYSFEERMGCGFGACMGCSCKTKYGNKRICKDGPVLEREEIIW